MVNRNRYSDRSKSRGGKESKNSDTVVTRTEGITDTNLSNSSMEKVSQDYTQGGSTTRITTWNTITTPTSCGHYKIIYKNKMGHLSWFHKILPQSSIKLPQLAQILPRATSVSPRLFYTQGYLS